MNDSLFNLQRVAQNSIDEFLSFKWMPIVISITIKMLIVVVLMYFSIKLGKHLIGKFVKRQIKSNALLSLDAQRAKTLGEVLKSVLKYSVYFLGLTIIISILFDGVSFTFASISGIAVGLGVQSLIKDLINGFFILFENQFGVGDHVTLGNFSGIVKSIGIRTTVIQDFNGDIHSLPNGSITGVTNHSRNDIRFVVDVNVSYREDIQRVMEIIKITCDEFESANKEYISEPLDVAGISALGLSGVTIRITGKAKPLMQWKMESELRMAIKLTLEKNKIEVPLFQKQ